jgi:S1-C subfamily serine protease
MVRIIVSAVDVRNTRKLTIVFFTLLLACTTIASLLCPDHIAEAQLQSSTNSTGNVTSSSSPSDSSIPGLFDKVKVSVVEISPTNKFANASLSGSGFVYDKNGHILTNSHVAGTAPYVIVTLIDGNQYNASVEGKDPVNDIAVLKIPENHTQPLIPVQFGNSSAARVGERVFAVGNPYGFADTLTGGFISQVGRLLLESGSKAPYPHPDMIQTDAVINPGNSGGPLVNLQGHVIGMNTATFNSQLGGATGLGFAVPSKTLLREVPIIIKNGSYPHPWLGLSGRALTFDLNRELGLSPNFKGVLVNSLVKDGPAEKAGVQGMLQSLHGDIIIALDGIPIRNTPDLLSYIENNKSPRERINITVYRDNHAKNLTATLGQRPTSLYTSSIITSQTPLF